MGAEFSLAYVQRLWNLFTDVPLNSEQRGFKLVGPTQPPGRLYQVMSSTKYHILSILSFSDRRFIKNLRDAPTAKFSKFKGRCDAFASSVQWPWYVTHFELAVASGPVAPWGMLWF